MKSKIIKKVLSGILSVSLMFQMGMTVVYAEESNPIQESKTITAFANLAEDLKKVTVPIGTSKEELALPEKVTAAESMKTKMVTSNPSVYTFNISEGGVAITKGTKSQTLKVRYNIKYDGYNPNYPAALKNVKYETSDNIPANTQIVLTGSTTAYYYGVTVDEGVQANIKIDSLSVNHKAITGGMKNPFSITGNSAVNLTLLGNNNLCGGWSHAGIYVASGSSLTVDGEGSLYAFGKYGGAGIGGNGLKGQVNFGKITINGGDVKAEALGGSAGIGTGSYLCAAGGDEQIGKSGIIMINGGKITAFTSFLKYDNGTPGQYYRYIGGAGIGGCAYGTFTNIMITGGNIIAKGSGGSAAIGTGYTHSSNGDKLSCGTINITGGSIAAEGNIGYGEENDRNKGQYVDGKVDIGDNANITVNNGNIIPSSAQNMVCYNLTLDVYDGALINESQDATLQLTCNSVTKTMTLPMTVKDYHGTVNTKLYAPSNWNSSTVEATIKYLGMSLNGSASISNNSVNLSFGKKLVKSNLLFTDSFINSNNAEFTVSKITVKQNGVELNKANANSEITLVVPQMKTAYYKNCTCVLPIWTPEGTKNTEIFVTVTDLNSGNEYSVTDQTIFADKVTEIQFNVKLPFSGTGTQTDPYIIKTADDLSYLANLVRAGQNYSGEYFKLNKDITYSSTPIGCFSESSNTNSPFCGNFDGAGHTVTLAMTNNSSGMQQAVALFGYLGSGASVKNISTTGTITSSGKYSAGIAGVAGDGVVNISNCRSNVEMDFTTGGDSTYGGIVGLINNSGNVTMTNCCFTGKIITTSNKGLEGVGGLCGWKSDTLNAVNCYVDASFGNSSISAKGKYMARNGGSFTNCYYNKEKILTDDNPANSTGNEAVTNDFASGKIAWLLQNGQSNSAVQVWGQTLTGDIKDSDPVLSSDSARAVHKVSYYQDNKELENSGNYVNGSTKITLRQISDLTPATGCNDVVGWYKGNDTTTLLQPGSEQLITSDTTYCTLSVNKETFYTINTQSKDSTLGTVEEGGKYTAGATVTLKAKPRMGCKFVKWSSDAEGNTVVSRNKTLTITANNSSTYYAWFAPDKYKLTVGNFNSSAGTVRGVKEEGYSYDEKADLTAESKVGYTFNGWMNEYNVTVTTSSAFSFKVSGNMTITPIFTKIDENTTYYTATFYHQSGDLLKLEKVAANSIVIPPNAPSKIGYDFIGWSIDGKNPVALNKDGSITITSNIILKPLFKVKEVTYSLTVNGKQATYSPLSSVTVQVTEMDIPKGKQFAYWKDEKDNIVSYSNPYNFSLTGNITLTAVYENSTEPVIKKPTLTLSASTYELINAGKHKMMWYAIMDLPEGYTLVESGILRMLSTTPQTNEQMTFDSEGIYRRIIQVSKSIPNQYYYSVAATDGKGVSVRAYIVVRDKNGNLETIFSDVQYGCYK